MRCTLPAAVALAATVTAVAAPAAGARPAFDAPAQRAVTCASRPPIWPADPACAASPSAATARPTPVATPLEAPDGGGVPVWIAVLVPLGAGATASGLALAARAGRQRRRPLMGA
jgi:hypothetical protein